MDKMIEIAIIPAAGFGKRMGLLTTFFPKEMFPLGRIPMIEHTITELKRSGIKGICVVIRKGKEVIEEYLKRQGYKGIEINFVYQRKPLGIGDALRRAKDFVGGAPFVMALPDQILLSKKPATQQLLAQHKEARGIWNSMIRVPKKEFRFFEGARSFRYQRAYGNVYVLKGFSQNKSSLIRGFGRTVFLSEALDYMTEEYLNDQTGEVDFLKTYKAIQERFPLYGTILKGVPCDLGTWEGYSYYLPTILRFMKREKDL
jgi:UTP--glucose-1-phosphate uridylyltransferase